MINCSNTPKKGKTAMTNITETDENEKGMINASLKKFFDDYRLASLLRTFRAENFGKNTVYRFLNSARTNWKRLVRTLPEMIIIKFCFFVS